MGSNFQVLGRMQQLGSSPPSCSLQQPPAVYLMCLTCFVCYRQLPPELSSLSTQHAVGSHQVMALSPAYTQAQGAAGGQAAAAQA